MQLTPLARFVTCAVFAGKRAAASSALAVQFERAVQSCPFPRFTGTRRRLARCLCSSVLALISFPTSASGAADSQAFGGTSPRSSGRVRSAAASTRAGNARPARARCGTATRAGVAVRACGTAAGRPLGRRVNDRERTSRPDGKARRDPARAATTAGTGRAAGGAVPLSVITLHHAPGSSSAEAPPACRRTFGRAADAACAALNLGRFHRQARGRLALSRRVRGARRRSSSSRPFHRHRAAARTLPVLVPAETRLGHDAQTRRG